MRTVTHFPACEAAIEWLTVHTPDLAAEIGLARFQGSGGTLEHHITVQLVGDPPDPVGVLEEGYRRALDRAGIAREGTVFRRVFCSDVLNQSYLFAGPEWRPLSIVGPPPAPAAKLALMAQPNSLVRVPTAYGPTANLPTTGRVASTPGARPTSTPRVARPVFHFGFTLAHQFEVVRVGTSCADGPWTTTKTKRHT